MERELLVFMDLDWHGGHRRAPVGARAAGPDLGQRMPAGLANQGMIDLLGTATAVPKRTRFNTLASSTARALET